MDLNTACSGFCYGLAAADHAIRAGAARNALVIGAERLSDFVDWSDRRTSILFGDAAGAAVVSAADEPGVGPVMWGSAPERGDVLLIEGWRPYIYQDGQAVFRWATTALAQHVRLTCERAGVATQDLAAFVAHQANTRIIDGIVRRLDLKDAVIAKDIVESGNTSAASIPLALSKLVERRAVPSGAPVLLFGFGGGLTYAGQVVRCP
jgi:3-oxoacyl-[acyl-carrier-protein] synthase-3